MALVDKNELSGVLVIINISAAYVVWCCLRKWSSFVHGHVPWIPCKKIVRLVRYEWINLKREHMYNKSLIILVCEIDSNKHFQSGTEVGRNWWGSRFLNFLWLFPLIISRSWYNWYPLICRKQNNLSQIRWILNRCKF